VNSAWNINSFNEGSNAGVKDYQRTGKKKDVKMSGQRLSARWRRNMELATRILKYEAILKRNEMNCHCIVCRQELI
jgi:hypothetical protein